MICKLMQTDRNDIKIEKSVSNHSHTLELPCKREIVTDTKSRNTSNITGATDVKMDGSVLEEKSSFKMLGLIFSSKLD